MSETSAPALPRGYLVLLYTLLAVHAGLVAWAAARALAVPRTDFVPKDFRTVTLASLAVSAILLFAFPRRTRAVALVTSLIALAAVLTPGAVSVVLLSLASAHVVGTATLRAVAPGAGRDAPLPWTVPILVGIALWIALLAATATLKLHAAPVYAACMLLPLALGWRDARALVLRLVAFTTAPEPYTRTERGWLALLVTMVVLHAFIVARPEVGYDASTMHMQFAVLVNEAHRWPFDVERWAWAVMPLGADWAYAVAYVVAGESAARATNLAFGMLAAAVVWQLVRLRARRELALASVCLLASTPLAFAETSSLYVENLWSAFLVAALLVTLLMRGGAPAPRDGWPVLALLAAGAMQSKVIGVLWLAPLLAYAVYLTATRPQPRLPDGRGAAGLALAAVIGAWPYANAWLRTGNPVFPFMNSVFRSPLADTTTSFDNPLYKLPLRPWSPWEIVTDAHRYIEGADGAAGFHWLFLLALVVAAFARRRPADFWLCAALGAVFFVAVYSQQAYLRYLFPFFLLLSVVGAWVAADLGDGRVTRVAMLVIGGALCLLDVRLIHAGNWPNAQLCMDCPFDDRRREGFKERYSGDRVVADWLNRTLPDARVGFLMLNAPSPAGYAGYSRAANWHDGAFYYGVAAAESADDIAKLVRRFGLTHVVYRTRSPQMETPAIIAYRERALTPLWTFQDFVVAAVKPPG